MRTLLLSLCAAFFASMAVGQEGEPAAKSPAPDYSKELEASSAAGKLGDFSKEKLKAKHELMLKIFDYQETYGPDFASRFASRLAYGPDIDPDSAPTPDKKLRERIAALEKEVESLKKLNRALMSELEKYTTKATKDN